MIRLALYGKGGIGKSTIAANLSATLASMGKKVMQIGCDPKHDSSRLLLRGRRAPTVLEYMRSTRPDKRSLGDIVVVGYEGTLCVEAGGPEPGVGCAGRGIISTFEILEELGMDALDPEVVIYDVLGDVVCGGFAVPLRRDFADMVILVTSGEFMSIYAANNILRGVRNYDGDRRRMAGIVFNAKGGDVEWERVVSFADAVGLPILVRIPRSAVFQEAERKGGTLRELFPESVLDSTFKSLAIQIAEGLNLHGAHPLDDDDLERTVLGRSGQHTAPVPVVDIPLKNERNLDTRVGQRGFLSKNVKLREPLYGCAFAGALTTTIQVDGAMTVAHCPRSCGDIALQGVLSSGRRSIARKGMVVRNQITPSVIVTDMTEECMVFGGMGPLENGLREAAESGLFTVFLITSCPSGIIGDDIRGCVRRVVEEYPDLRVLPISTDGNIAGDFMQGVMNACIQGAGSLIDPSIEPEGNLVNIVAEKTIASNTDSNFLVAKSMLQKIGVEVNCRFVARTSLESIKNLKRADLNILANYDYFASVIRDFLQREHGLRFASSSLPVGPFQTRRWLEELARHFGNEEVAETILDRLATIYREKLEEIRGHLEGKRLMIFTWHYDVDWIIELAFDLGMEVCKVCVFNKPDYGRDKEIRTRFGDRIIFETDYPPSRRYAEIEEQAPDLVIANYIPSGMPSSAHYDTFSFCPDVGFFSGLKVAERWRRILLTPSVEGWRGDGDV